MAHPQPFTERVLAAPFIINGAVNQWPSRQWTVDTLGRILAGKTFRCRLMPRERDARDHPAWESGGVYIDCLLQEFSAWCHGEAREDNPLAVFSPRHFSAYIDYKYMTQVFAECPHLLKEVQWSSLGLQGVDGLHSTLWIGSPGASTPCHYDTYGFNLVAQIQGRKRWVLFPPEDSRGMYPTRIPYEESSVFSQVDLAHPNLGKFPLFKKSRPVVVTLEPGQVLYVPRHWWHYVTCTQVAVSINTWVEMTEDNSSRLEEAVTRILASSLIPHLSQTASPTAEDDWVNPTEELESASSNMQYLKAALLPWQQALMQDSAARTGAELNTSSVARPADSCVSPIRSSVSAELDHSHAQSFAGTAKDNADSGKTNKQGVASDVRRDCLEAAQSEQRSSVSAELDHSRAQSCAGTTTDNTGPRKTNKHSDVNTAVSSERPDLNMAVSNEHPDLNTAVSSEHPDLNTAVSIEHPDLNTTVSIEHPDLNTAVSSEHQELNTAVSSEHPDLSTAAGTVSVGASGNQKSIPQKCSELKTISRQENTTEQVDSSLKVASLQEEKTDQRISNRNARLLQLARALQHSTVRCVNSPFALSELCLETLESSAAQTRTLPNTDAAGDLKSKHTAAVPRKRKNPEGTEKGDGPGGQSDQESCPQRKKIFCARENKDGGRETDTPGACSEREKGTRGEDSAGEACVDAWSPESELSVFVPRPCCLEEYLKLIKRSDQEDQGTSSSLEEDIKDGAAGGSAGEEGEGKCLAGVQEALLKSVLHPDVVKLIVEKLKEQV